MEKIYENEIRQFIRVTMKKTDENKIRQFIRVTMEKIVENEFILENSYTCDFCIFVIFLHSNKNQKFDHNFFFVFKAY